MGGGSCTPPDLPYSVLGLYTEEEGGGEVLDVLHTDNMVRTPVSVSLEVSWSNK